MNKLYVYLGRSLLLIFAIMALPCLPIGLAQKSTIQGKDGEKYSIIKLEDGKWWSAVNLNTDHTQVYCYQNSAKNCLIWGGLYTFEEAKKVCSRLGPGWHLPSQAAWDRMLSRYGAILVSDTEFLEDRQFYLLGRAPYQALMKGGKSQLDLLLGGYRTANGKFTALFKSGGYWTATETTKDKAWMVGFSSRDKKATLSQGQKKQALSVRCIEN